MYRYRSRFAARDGIGSWHQVMAQSRESSHQQSKSRRKARRLSLAPPPFLLSRMKQATPTVGSAPGGGRAFSFGDVGLQAGHYRCLLRVRILRISDQLSQTPNPTSPRTKKSRAGKQKSFGAKASSFYRVAPWTCQKASSMMATTNRNPGATAPLRLRLVRTAPAKGRRQRRQGPLGHGRGAQSQSKALACPRRHAVKLLALARRCLFASGPRFFCSG